MTIVDFGKQESRHEDFGYFLFGLYLVGAALAAGCKDSMHAKSAGKAGALDLVEVKRAFITDAVIAEDHLHLPGEIASLDIDPAVTEYYNDVETIQFEFRVKLAVANQGKAK